MNKAKILSGPALWTLVAGVAIGAGTMYSFFTGSGSLALAQDAPAATRPASLTKSESLDALRTLDSAYATLAQYASPAVVLIKSESKGTPGLNGMGSMPRGGEGSGVIFRPDGYVVTNDHVVGGFDKVTVVLKDGREFPGKVIRAEESDIAVVKIEADHLPTLKFADSSQVKVGQIAMAIGAPYGFENTVTIGHVSALGRENAIADQQTGQTRLYPDLIQTDAAINMGNSGGPLIDVNGDVIGINSSIVSPNGGGVGIGFAITSNQARLLAETLIEKGKITRAFLGLVPENLKDYQKQQMHVEDGALVTDVQSDGPAAIAGIKKGDVIVKIGDVPVTNQVDLRNSMMKYAPGTTVPVDVVRDGAHKSISVKLSTPPKQPVAQREQPNIQQFDGPGDMPDLRNQIPDLRDFMKQFGQDGPAQSAPEAQNGKARLGVSVQDVSENLRKQFHIPANAKGAVVVSVQPDSVADHLGMQAGDLITRFAGKDVTSADQLVAAMTSVNWGDRERITYQRFGTNSSEKNEISVHFK